MNCPKCNTPLVNGVCPNCSNEEVFEDFDSIEEKSVNELTIPPIETKEEVVKTDDVVIGSQEKAKKFKNKITLKIDKDAKMPTVLAILFIAIFFFVGISFGKMFFSKTIVTTSNTTVNKNSLKANGKNNTTYIDGVTYQIPTKYIYDKTLNGVLIYDPEDNFRIYIRRENGSYDILTSSITSIKASLTTTDINVINIKEVDIESKKALAIEGTTKLTNRLIAFTHADKDQIFYIEIVTSDNKFNYDVLSLALDIAASSKIEKSSSNMEKISIEDVAKLIVTAANAYNSIKK